MKKYFFELGLLLIPSFFALADDTIIPFNESWAINVSAKYGITSFSQEQSAQYTTDRPWAMGLGIRYKNTSAAFYLPSFYAFDDNPLKSFNIHLSSYYDFIYYEAFCNRYQGFSDGATENKSIDLDIFSTGISAGWIQNGKKHSLSAVYDLDSKQLSSSGSVLLGFGVFYTSLFSDDKNIKRYSSNQHLLYFGPNVGYSYTFIFSKNIFLNINCVIGIDTGLNINENKWLFVPLVMPKIAFGHHNNTWSINVIAGCNYTAIFWDINNRDNLLPATMKLTFSKRL